MNEKGRMLAIGEKKHKLIFNTQALYEVTQRFGGYIEMLEAMGIRVNEDSTKDEPKKKGKKVDKKKSAENVPVFAWLIALTANQSIEIQNIEKGEDKPLITEKQVMLYLPPSEFPEAKSVLMGALNDGMIKKITDENDDDKDEVLEELKNGNSAAVK